MFPFRLNNYSPDLPNGFVLDTLNAPSPRALNRLLSKCNQATHPAAKLALALEKSCCCLSILEQSSGRLSGFVRATSDKGLNANLWDLAAQPGELQGQLLEVLVDRALFKLRREMPGCSISVAAPLMSLNVLQDNGFLLDPGGIRAMGFRLRL